MSWSRTSDSKKKEQYACISHIVLTNDELVLRKEDCQTRGP